MNETATILYNFGFPAKLANCLADTAHENGLSLANVQAWLNEAKSSRSLHNPLGFVRARLQAGDQLPERSLVDRHISERHRYVTQWNPPRSHTSMRATPVTRTCACGRVVWADRLCEDCGLCPKCCTCEALSLDEE